jgi:type II secretory pathway pseudopilin PulG
MRAFSLIETLIYIGLFSLIMTGAVLALQAVSESSGNGATRALIAEEGLFITQKIDRALEDSDGSTSGIVWNSSAESLSLKEAGGELVQLNGGNVRVFAFSFDATEATFTLSATSSTGTLLSQAFTTTYYGKN